MSRFRLVGTGATKVLLLPGLTGTQRGFDAMLALGDTERFQFAVLDYRGYGGAIAVAGEYSMAEIVADAVDLIAVLGWEELILAGHSIGALAAQMVAVAMPGRIQGLILLAGMHAGGGSRLPERRQLLKEAAYSRDQRIALVEGGSGGRYRPGFARAVVDDSWDEIRPAAFAGYAASAAETDVRDQVRHCGMPALVVVGELDPVNTAQLAQATTLDWLPNAVLEIVEGVGHYPMLEAPARSMALIEAFAGGMVVRTSGTVRT
jgi:pimeloyl-ACP methyl ester carboxylesterase